MVFATTLSRQTNEMNPIDDFLQWLEAERRYSPLTVRNYRRDIDDFVGWCGMTRDSFEPRDIRREDIEDWALYLFEERGLKASSVNRSIASLRSLWHRLMAEGRVERDVVSLIRRYKTPRRLPLFVPDTRMEAVVERLREQIASDEFESLRDALVVLLIYTAGLRLSELVASNVEDLADDLSTIRVVGKGNRERVQPIALPVRAILKKYFSQKFSQNICTGQKKALILSNKGERISRRTVQRIVDRMLKEAGVQGRTSPHVLRHTFATRLLNDGSDLREIQELLGHSSLRATQVYTHTDIERLKDIYASAHPRERD